MTTNIDARRWPVTFFKPSSLSLHRARWLIDPKWNNLECKFMQTSLCPSGRGQNKLSWRAYHWSSGGSNWNTASTCMMQLDCHSSRSPLALSVTINKLFSRSSGREQSVLIINQTLEIIFVHLRYVRLWRARCSHSSWMGSEGDSKWHSNKMMGLMQFTVKWLHQQLVDMAESCNARRK